MSDYIDPSRLQLEDVIGQGAFGVVLRGSFRDMDGQTHEVAVKQIVDEIAPAPSPSAPTPRENFMAKVSITIPASKDSDHVVHCHGWTATRDSKLALVMRLYDKSLHALIDKQGGRVLPLHEVVGIALDMAKGLLELHTKGIMFENMKPSNVLLDASRRAFLADFGVSKPMKDLSKVYTKHTAWTYFMSPEKLRSHHGANVRVGFPADIWSYGVTVMQLLCSDLDAPYGPGIDIHDVVIMLHIEKEAPRVPAVPEAPELQHTLQACMSVDFDERPTAAQLVQALQRISDRLVGATQPSVSAAQGPSTSQDAMAAEALRVQLAAAEARAAAAEARAAAAEAEAAAGRRRLAEEAQLRQQMASHTEVERTEQEEAAAAAKTQQQQQQQQALRPLQLLSSPTCRATLTGHSYHVTSVAYTLDGLTLASGSCDSSIKLWSVASGVCSATLQGHSDWVMGVAISQDGRLMASGSVDKTVKLWDLGSRMCTTTLTGHTCDVNSVAISPDGATLASGSDDTSIRLWDPRSGSCKAKLEGHSSGVWCVALSSDGALLAICADRTLRIWDTRSARSIAVMEGHGQPVSTVVFSPDGTAVLSGSSDNTIKVWDVKTRQCLRTLEGHTDDVNSVALTPGGQHAVSGSMDSTIKIWDWRGSGRCLATLEGHSESVNSVATSPDGKMLASGSDDETIKLWRIAQ